MIGGAVAGACARRLSLCCIQSLILSILPFFSFFLSPYASIINTRHTQIYANAREELERVIEPLYQKQQQQTILKAGIFFSFLLLLLFYSIFFSLSLSSSISSSSTTSTTTTSSFFLLLLSISLIIIERRLGL